MPVLVEKTSDGSREQSTMKTTIKVGAQHTPSAATTMLHKYGARQRNPNFSAATMGTGTTAHSLRTKIMQAKYGGMQGETHLVRSGVLRFSGDRAISQTLNAAK